HTRFSRDWSSDVCSSDLGGAGRARGRPVDVRAAVVRRATTPRPIPHTRQTIRNHPPTAQMRHHQEIAWPYPNTATTTSSYAAAGPHWSAPAASTAADATNRSCPDNPGTSATYPATHTSTPAPNTDTATATQAANAPSQTHSHGHAPGGHSDSITRRSQAIFSHRPAGP